MRLGSLLVASLLLALLTPPTLAQQLATCPIVDDSIVSGVLGGPVETSVSHGQSSGMDLCDFVDGTGTDYEVGRQLNAFGQDEATGAAMLAFKYNPDWVDAAQSQILSLDQPGATLSLDGYDMTSVSGIGDAAVWIQDQTDPSNYQDSLLIERGSDIFAVAAPDAPDAQTKLYALAQAVLSNS